MSCILFEHLKTSSLQKCLCILIPYDFSEWNLDVRSTGKVVFFTEVIQFDNMPDSICGFHSITSDFVVPLDFPLSGLFVASFLFDSFI